MTSDAFKVVLGGFSYFRDQGRRGIQRFSFAYASELSRQAPEHLLRVEIPHNQGVGDQQRSFGGHQVSVDELYEPRETEGQLVYHALWPLCDAPLWQVWPRWSRTSTVALVVTLYDAIPLRFPDAYLGHQNKTWYLSRLQLLRQADAVLALTAAAAAEAIELIGIDPQRVHIVGAASPLRGWDREPDPLQVGRELSAVRPHPLIYVTDGEQRKNNARLIDAFSRLPRDLRRKHQLVLVGHLSVRSRMRLRNLISRRGLDDDVLLTGEISDAALVGLYRIATAAIFPSLAEGFGLPALEAATAGLPVVVSDLPPLREIITDSKARFDPTSTAAIVGALRRVLTDEEFRARAKRNHQPNLERFSWDRVVSGSLQAYAAAAERRASSRRKPRRPVRRRIAVVTPLPPTRSPAALYGARLCDVLGEQDTVDVYEDGGRGLWSGSTRTRIYPARSFGWRREQSVAGIIPLYTIGKSACHVEARALLGRFRGDALLYDTRLDQRPPSSLPAAWWRSAVSTRASGREGAWQMSSALEVVDRSRRTYVLTVDLRRRLVEERPARADDIHVVPLGFPEPTTPHSTEPLVVALVEDPEHAGLIVRASLPLLSSKPASRLLLMGAVDNHTRMSLVDLLRRCGKGDQVMIAGPLGAVERRRRLRQAAVAVQISTHFQGEAAISTADAIASGTPTIVNDAGWAAELPPSVVVRVPTVPDRAGLGEAIFTLFENQPLRQELSDSALEHAAANGTKRAADALRALVLT